MTLNHSQTQTHLQIWERLTCFCLSLHPMFNCLQFPHQFPQKLSTTTSSSPTRDRVILWSYSKHTMVLFRRTLLLVLWLLLFVFIFGHCHGSRNSNVFKLKHKSQHHGHFFGFLPKRMPIPYSTPSRKHNDIGLKSTWRSPWRRRRRSRLVVLDKGDSFGVLIYIFFFLLLLLLASLLWRNKAIN